MASASTIGPHRESNQDRVAVASIYFGHGKRPPLKVAIICDGMGGLIDGSVAASEAVGIFIAVIALSEGSIERSVSQAVHAANLAVHKKLDGQGGTTLTAVVSNNLESWCVHVGDSRLYDYGTDGLSLLSVDDTVQGAVNAHEGGGHEDMLDNRLLQFVGIGGSLTPHIFPLSQRVDHFWILTSDGAHGLGRSVLESLFERSRNADDVVRRLVYVADALNVKDNASIAAVRQQHFTDQVPEMTGTTLVINSPNGVLELWLSETFMGKNSFAEFQDEPVPPAKIETAKSLSILKDENSIARKKRTRRKTSHPRSKNSNPPQLEVQFDIEKTDDDRPT